jgi:hypothetical protein
MDFHAKKSLNLLDFRSPVGVKNTLPVRVIFSV